MMPHVSFPRGRAGSQRAAGRTAVPGAVVVAALAAALVAGCAGTALKQGPGGLPQENTAQVSLVVAQTRAQFPSLSGVSLPFQRRPAPDADDAAQPEPALEGTGVGVRPGVQMGERPRVRVSLHLEKARYATGFARLTLPDGSEERWNVVAYDQRGNADGSFDFTYLLTDPQGGLRYLVVIGGEYEEEGERYRGFEGTLVRPGAGHDLENWDMAYKIDFGYRFPVTPTYAREVEQAEELFRDLGRKVDELERLQERLRKTEAELEDLRAGSGGEGEGAAAREAAIEEAETRRAGLRTDLEELTAETQDDFVRYYALRGSLSNHYAAFVESNPYRWADRPGKQDYYDRWKPVEFHHPRIDKLVDRFLPFAEDEERVLKARTSAMAIVTKNNNWDKVPGGRP